MSETASPTPKAGSKKDLEGKVDDLGRRVRALEAALGALAMQKAKTPPPSPRPKLEAPADGAKLKALEAKNAELTRKYEEIEGEYQALKLRSESLNALKGQVDLSELNIADPAVSATIEQLVAENAQLSRELGEVRQSSTQRLRRLEEVVEEKAEEVEVVAKQKENLLRELANRDAHAVESPELTLEQITASPVFKQMLGNIRRTSREEVTLLHDAIVKLGESDPAAYDKVLDVVEVVFRAAKVENPLALLERKG